MRITTAPDFKLELSPEIAGAYKQVEQIAERLGLQHGNPIQHTPEELRMLYEVACGAHDSTKIEGDIVQCGTWKGGTARLMGEAVMRRNLGETVVTIDNFQGNGEQSRHIFAVHKEILNELVMSDCVVSVWHDDIHYLSRFPVSRLRMAVLDSQHSYKHVIRQISLVNRLLIFNGWLVVHDFTEEGPRAAINEYLESVDYTYTAFECGAYVFIKTHSPIL